MSEDREAPPTPEELALLEEVALAEGVELPSPPAGSPPSWPEAPLDQAASIHLCWVGARTYEALKQRDRQFLWMPRAWGLLELDYVVVGRSTPYANPERFWLLRQVTHVAEVPNTPGLLACSVRPLRTLDRRALGPWARGAVEYAADARLSGLTWAGPHVIMER